MLSVYWIWGAVCLRWRLGPHTEPPLVGFLRRLNFPYWGPSLLLYSWRKCERRYLSWCWSSIDLFGGNHCKSVQFQPKKIADLASVGNLVILCLVSFFNIRLTAILRLEYSSRSGIILKKVEFLICNLIYQLSLQLLFQINCPIYSIYW